ncbi:hypothetical protein [Nannocystis sp. SCPEA4]|uniref:hypothetical protein n=1 Tax=Nannocystis sp. SCPEA4 TaxID=2996787 RepID=UPI00226E7E71|nr:hypothetical protein [Nannocystis sp. SCPEA4]MCY1054540.1 hypothetical protein [Nannocystis sp. SCPEA4]
MQTFKMILGGALVAGSLTGCVISTGGTDTNLTLTSDTNANTETDATAGTESTDGTATDASATEGTASATEGTAGTDTTAPTTTAPATTEEPPTSTSTTSTTTGGAGVCGWSPDDSYYTCNFEGEDPDGMYPIACPANLVEGEPCTNTGLTGEGCCDANGDNWYCGTDEETMMQIVVLNPCT